MRRAPLVVLLALLLGAPLAGPWGGAGVASASGSGACPFYEHHEWASPDGAYFVTFDHIVCRDASGASARHYELVRVTQGDPHDNASVTLARVEHAWARDGATSWALAENVALGDATANASARDQAAGSGALGGACAASVKVREGAFGAEWGVPGTACPAPWVFLL